MYIQYFERKLKKNTASIQELFIALFTLMLQKCTLFKTNITKSSMKMDASIANKGEPENIQYHNLMK
jgi:hypothetical protein